MVALGVETNELFQNFHSNSQNDNFLSLHKKKITETNL